MAEEGFVGKEVTVKFEVREVVSYTGRVVADDEKGILLHRPYRKGLRLELVPRGDIRGVYATLEKGHKRRRGKKAEVEEPETDDDLDEEDDDFEDDSDEDVDWED